MTWPLVDINDDGIRPAGRPDECFYCQQKVGQPHGPNCVIVHKTVKVRYLFDIEIEVPHSWDKHSIEFHRNDSSWCADNAINDINDYQERIEKDGECLCNHFKCEYQQEADPTPRRKLKEELKPRYDKYSVVELQALWGYYHTQVHSNTLIPCDANPGSECYTDRFLEWLLLSPETAEAVVYELRK